MISQPYTDFLAFSKSKDNIMRKPINYNEDLDKAQKQIEMLSFEKENFKKILKNNMKPYSRKQSPTEINEKRYIPNFVLSKRDTSRNHQENFSPSPTKRSIDCLKNENFLLKKQMNEMKNCEVDCDEMRNEIKNLKLEIAVLKNQTCNNNTVSNIEVNRQDNSFVKEKNDKKDKLVNEKMETELESLFQQLCTNLEENNQLNDLFLRFFQTKTKLAFLFDEKEYKLILMKFLAFFNELIIKINNASSSKIYHPTEKDYSTYQTSESLINCYDEYTHYNQNPTRHFENITNNQIYKNSYAELPYNSYNVIPTYQSTNNLNTLDNQYSPNPNEKLFPKNNKKMHEEKKVNFYGDLSNSNFNLTKYEPSKKDIYSLNKNNDTSTPVKVRNFQKKEIEVMPHLKEKYSFFKGETLSPKQTLYNNRSLENRIQTEKTTTKDDLDIDIIPKKRKFTNSKSKEKYDFLTTHQ